MPRDVMADRAAAHRPDVLFESVEVTKGGAARGYGPSGPAASRAAPPPDRRADRRSRPAPRPGNRGPGAHRGSPAAGETALNCVPARVLLDEPRARGLEVEPPLGAGVPGGGEAPWRPDRGGPFANVGDAHRRGVYAARSVLPVQRAAGQFGTVWPDVTVGRPGSPNCRWPACPTPAGFARPSRQRPPRHWPAEAVTAAGSRPLLFYTALAPVALAVSSVSFFTDDTASAIVLSVVFIGLQADRRPGPGRPSVPDPARLDVPSFDDCAALRVGPGEHRRRPGPPLFPLYLPVVVAAAALGPAQAIVIGVHRGRDLPRARTCDAARPVHRPGPAGRRRADPRGLALVGVSTVLAIGTGASLASWNT